MSMTTSPRMGGREWALLLLLSLLWGSSFLLAKIAVVDVQPLSLVLLRVGLAALALWIVLLATGRRVPGDARLWLALFAMGGLNNLIPFSLIFWGQIHIASGLASILNATTPLWTVLLAHVLTADEKLTGARLAGVAAGLAGVVVMIGPAVLGGMGRDVVAQLAVVAAAVSYALAAIFGRRFRAMGVPPLVTAAGQVTASTVLLLPIALLVDTPWRLAPPSPTSWAAILALALLCTAVAYELYFRILAAAGATNLLLVTFLIPVSAILLGAVVLGERLEPRHFGGMALIAAGLAAIDGRLPQLVRRHARWGAA